jgi:hypothetical protein
MLLSVFVKFSDDITGVITIEPSAGAESSTYENKYVFVLTLPYRLMFPSTDIGEFTKYTLWQHAVTKDIEEPTTSA